MSTLRRLRTPHGARAAAMASAVLLALLASGCSPGSEETAPAETAPAAPAGPASPSPTAPLRLAAGETVARTLAAGAVDRFRIDLEAGELLHLVLEQQGVDVALALFDAGGGPGLEVDRPIDDRGPEELIWVASGGGPHRLEVAAAPGAAASGRYTLRILALRPARPEDRERAEAARIFAAGEALWWAGELAPAAGRYGEALARWQRLGDRAGQAETLHRLGVVATGQGDRRAAAGLFARSADGFRQVGDDRLEAIALTHRGEALFALGELAAARAAHERALPLRQSSGDRLGEAITRNNLGQIHQLRGEVETARGYYEAAVELVSEERAPAVIATARHNLGTLYRWLGQGELARQQLAVAARIWPAVGSPGRQAATLNQLGRLQREAGDLESARSAHQRALALRREAGDARGEAAALSELGQTLEGLGREEEALAAYARALSLLADLGRPRSRAKVLLYEGALLDRLGRTGEAVGALTAALALYRELEEPRSEADCLLALARAERRRDDLATARRHLERSLDLLETLRARVLGGGGRGSFFATAQPHFDAAVDLLQELHSRHPGAGFAALAFETHERSQGRVLRDQLLAGGPAPGLGSAALQAEIGRLAERRQRLLDTVESLDTSQRRAALAGAQLEELDAELRLALDRLDRLRAPQPAATAASRAERIRRELLGADTVLVAYRLGEPRSFVWALSAERLVSAELAGRGRLDELARQAHGWLTRSHRPEARPALERTLCELSRELLAPVAPALAAGGKLLVAADGGLHYLPFAALPEPSAADCAGAPPLVAGREISYVTSATAALERRAALRDRPPAPGLLAVVADPVFGADDERLAPGGRPSPAGGWPRLPFSGQEAEAVLALAAGAGSLRATGLEAGKPLVTSGRLAGYRILHFATHGVLDTEQPELSGLVLSLVDEAGRPVDGTLRGHEIAGLDLPADLVVLSACRTALGRELRGEGLVGLARSFFAAGAARVVVSLWPVADRGTAELMERFYRRHLGAGEPPAAALRSAQRDLAADRRRSAPYHWAGFVLLGDPR